MRILIIAAVLITDELFKEREKPSDRTGGTDDLGHLDNIISRIDKALDSGS